MSFIPNCRTHEYYNQKYLNQKDKEFISGYDWCVEMAVDNFFDNNYDHDDEGYLEHILAQELPECMKQTYEMENTFREEGEPETEERETKTYADLLRMQILEWIEMERSRLITSMIDNMSEEDYNANKEKADAEGQSEEGNGRASEADGEEAR